MSRIEGNVFILRPTEEVFDFVAEQRNEPSYNPNMLTSEKITEGPIGVGTRFTATVRAGHQPRPMEIEYTAFDRPHLLASTIRMATADFTGTLTFTSTRAGTRLRWSYRARWKGPLRLLAAVLGPNAARQQHLTCGSFIQPVARARLILLAVAGTAEVAAGIADPAQGHPRVGETLNDAPRRNSKRSG
jgi:uncharacterized protein YndB with AHSA1/START domain